VSDIRHCEISAVGAKSRCPVRNRRKAAFVLAEEGPLANSTIAKMPFEYELHSIDVINFARLYAAYRPVIDQRKGGYGAAATRIFEGVSELMYGD
jgi:hypothetical protein